ncbi:hypothetical protein ACWEKT_23235 [Nocardia takedensis]|uniref:hypothetical protein n=1 Tax=Nocardia takedensis TaxID=259390 RepID=UPI0012F6C20A|nr:hypothetical protein [Nocardia takedensis]
MGRRVAARPSPPRTPVDEALIRTRAERAQLEQGRLFHALLLEEAEELHEELRVLHEELREIHRNLHRLRRRFPSLPPLPAPAGVPSAGGATGSVGLPRPSTGQASA